MNDSYHLYCTCMSFHPLVFDMSHVDMQGLQRADPTLGCMQIWPVLPERQCRRGRTTAGTTGKCTSRVPCAREAGQPAYASMLAQHLAKGGLLPA